MALEIKRLVHGEGYTLVGARQALEQTQRSHGAQSSQPAANGEAAKSGDKRRDQVTAAIGHARAELREIAGLLANPAPQPQKRQMRMAPLRRPSGTLFPGH
jgi:hypothetical protein